MGRFSLTALVCLLALLGLAGPGVADPFPSHYDGAIKAAWEKYHPGEDWRWWKAQLYQESLLNPDARSHAGAVGLAQFMPATWKEVSTAMRLGAVDRRMAEPSILAGAFYMRRLVLVWRAPRTAESRRRLSQASYNAGAGSLIRAQKKCGGAVEWEGISPCLVRVTGKHSRETLQYVEKIERWRSLMS